MNLSAKGMNGTIEFDGRNVTIRREGVFGRLQFGASVQVVPLHQIAAVQWKRPGLTVGVLSLVLTGGNWAPTIYGGGLMPQGNPMKDPHSFVFWRKRLEEFEAIRDAIQNALNDLGATVR